MSAYINKETGEYPRYEGDIRLVHPEIGETFVCPPCFELVEEMEPPVYDEAKQTIIENQPELVDGKYVRFWSVRDFTQEELDIMAARPNENLRVYGYDMYQKKYVLTKTMRPEDAELEIIGKTAEEIGALSK